MVLSDSHSMLKSNLLRTYGLLMRPSGQAMRHLRFMPSAVIGVAQQPTKFAVIGAGLAGLATTWHLLVGGSREKPVHVLLHFKRNTPNAVLPVFAECMAVHSELCRQQFLGNGFTLAQTQC